MVPLLSYLREAGVVAVATVSSTPLGELLVQYRSWMVQERNLALTTVLRYENTARRFLQEQASTGEVFAPDNLTGADVNAFLLRECSRALLEVELADRDIAIADDPIRAALDTIDRLTQTVDGLTWRAGVRHSQIQDLKAERRRFLHQLPEIQRTIGDVDHNKGPASTGKTPAWPGTIAPAATPVNFALSNVDGGLPHG